VLIFYTCSYMIHNPTFKIIIFKKCIGFMCTGGQKMYLKDTFSISELHLKSCYKIVSEEIFFVFYYSHNMNY